jgi:hypothetical protein
MAAQRGNEMQQLNAATKRSKSAQAKEAQNQAHDNNKTHDVNDGVHNDSTCRKTSAMVGTPGSAPCQPVRTFAVGRRRV